MQTSPLVGRVSGSATMLAGMLWAIGGVTSLNADYPGIGMDGPHLLHSRAVLPDRAGKNGRLVTTGLLA